MQPQFLSTGYRELLMHFFMQITELVQESSQVERIPVREMGTEIREVERQMVQGVQPMMMMMQLKMEREWEIQMKYVMATQKKRVAQRVKISET